MRQLLLHVGNAIVWLTIWLAVAIYFHSLGDPPRLIGEAIIPGILWCLTALALRRWLRRRRLLPLLESERSDNWSDGEKEAFRNLTNKPRG